VATAFIALAILPRFMLRTYFEAITSPQKRNKAITT
jgi:hypothetical protein